MESLVEVGPFFCAGLVHVQLHSWYNCSCSLVLWLAVQSFPGGVYGAGWHSFSCAGPRQFATAVLVRFHLLSGFGFPWPADLLLKRYFIFGSVGYFSVQNIDELAQSLFKKALLIFSDRNISL